VLRPVEQKLEENEAEQVYAVVHGEDPDAIQVAEEGAETAQVGDSSSAASAGSAGVPRCTLFALWWRRTSSQSPRAWRFDAEIRQDKRL